MDIAAVKRIVSAFKTIVLEFKTVVSCLLQGDAYYMNITLAK